MHSLSETKDGRVIAVEVKATAAPSLADARHLEWLYERLDSKLAAALLVHTGPQAFRLTERILAVPIGSLWTPSQLRPLALSDPSRARTCDLSPMATFSARYRMATAPEPNSSRLASFKSTCFDSPANNIGPWPASRGPRVFEH